MSVLTLAIGIGASALMLSVVSTILLKPLPYGDPDRIEMLWGSYPDANLGVPEQPTHGAVFSIIRRSEEHTSELQSLRHLVCRLLLEKKKKSIQQHHTTRHTRCV